MAGAAYRSFIIMSTSILRAEFWTWRSAQAWNRKEGTKLVVGVEPRGQIGGSGGGQSGGGG